MKLTRRLCALLLAALLMLSAAGCSSEPSSTASDSPSESSSSQPEEFPSEPEESSSEAEELPSEAEPGSVPETPADSGSSSQAAQPTLTFQGETVLEAAVLDYDLHFTADCPLTLLEPVKDDLTEAAEANDDSGSRAIILFTDAGRHYVWLGEGSPLHSVWESAYNAQSEKNLHWYTHMTTSKITEINLDSFQGRVSTTDPAVIAQISDYLKHNLTATPSKDPETVNFPINPDTPGTLYSVEIKFDTGVRYFGFGYGEMTGNPDPGGSTYYLYSSDLDQTVTYTLSEGSAAKLRRLMADFSPYA